MLSDDTDDTVDVDDVDDDNDDDNDDDDDDEGLQEDEVSPVPSLSVQPLAGGVLPCKPIYSHQCSAMPCILCTLC